jgi:regulator of protease activity HflC (stomatin/prohibitin superfamily)
MLHRLNVFMRAIRRWVARKLRPSGEAPAAAPFSAEATLATISAARNTIIVVAVVAAFGWLLYRHPPVDKVDRGEIGVRTNQLTGGVTLWREGSVFVLPGLFDMRVYSLRDQVWRPEQVRRADGQAPLQSIEGLSVGVDLAVRYALDPARVAANSRSLPDNIGGEIVEPAVQGVIYKVFARYTVREIFSVKRVEIQQAIESELRTRLASDGVLLKSVQMGKVDLPGDYRRGMERLLAEELETQKMQYTLELKEKRVKETELEASADKARREVQAEAAAREQVIAAKAQEEAMKHVLPFKQRQIEQRSLEAEAEKQARVKAAEANSQARQIEANGEAEARRKLADAEAWRLERVGKVNAEQMAREGAVITQHPLLVQKTLADKLSDKVQVIIAPPPRDGGFIGDAILGHQASAKEQ